MERVSVTNDLLHILHFLLFFKSIFGSWWKLWVVQSFNLNLFFFFSFTYIPFRLIIESLVSGWWILRKFVSNFTFLRSAARLIGVNLHPAVFHYAQVVSSLLVCHRSLSSPLSALRLDGWDGCPILRLATLLLFVCCVRRFLNASSDGLLAPEWKWETSERCFVPSLFLSLFVWNGQHLMRLDHLLGCRAEWDQIAFVTILLEV